eukprot:6990-Heterococcus_DN1.PRE.3
MVPSQQMYERRPARIPEARSADAKTKAHLCTLLLGLSSAEQRCKHGQQRLSRSDAISRDDAHSDVAFFSRWSITNQRGTPLYAVAEAQGALACTHVLPRSRSTICKIARSSAQLLLPISAAHSSC